MDTNATFTRQTWCILGLPFDAISLEETANQILNYVAKKQRCFLSTPNLNFVCAAQSDTTFRASVINSDLSIADGFPIVLVAKLLGIPISERVAGSDLIEHLFHQKSLNPIKVFFFGGEAGAGARASQKINQSPSGLTAVGHFVPGFGPVEDMGKPEIINYINQHDIDFLIVSLGAKKGQAWIENNKNQLKAPVISHLGAVVNFFAGTVKRAPVWMQRLGLEWFWRILQEPAIWRRYYHDGLVFSKLMLMNIIPYAIWQRSNKNLLANKTPIELNIKEIDNLILIELNGPCNVNNVETLKRHFKEQSVKKKSILLDFQSVPVLDAAFLGLCMSLTKAIEPSGCVLHAKNLNKNCGKIINWSCANYLFKP